MESRTDEITQRIARDFADPRLAFPGLRFAPANEWTNLVPAADNTPRGNDGYHETDLVCISGRHSFLVDGADDDEHILVAVASMLQDDAIAALGAPWPSIEIDGEFRGVLEPQISAEGNAVWSVRTGFSCPIGTLQDTFGAAHVIA